MPTRTPIFAGRWQPFHNGHCHVLAGLVEQYERVIVGIVCPDPDNPPDPKFDRFHPDANPLYYWERLYMITQLARARGWLGRVRIVPMWHPRVALDRETQFLPPRRQRFWYVPMVGESEHSKARDLRKLGEEVVLDTEIPNEDLGCRSSTVRQALLAKRNYADMVPPSVAEYLTQLDTKELRWRDRARPFPIVAGRWQPLHKGHMWAIEDTIEKHGEAVIGIVNSEPGDAEWQDYPSFHPVHNPFSFWDRLEMLSAALDEAGVRDKCYIVPLWHPRKTIDREEAFLPCNRFWVIPETSNHETEKIAELQKRGEEVYGLTVDQKFASISSTVVKARMITGQDWKELVPRSVASYIEANHGVEMVTAAIQRYRDVFNRYAENESRQRREFASGVDPD